MTIEDNMNQSFENLSCDDTQQAPATPPFHMVLVDIREAACEKICCVEIPLELDKDLKYVAISYRWGELSETMIDTELGYTASITSFDLSDFYDLCRIMLKEKDLQEMKYVWIDAICVDQTNYERRKATIHHMSTIYEHANYIVAVPDLHLAYLNKTAAIKKITVKTAGIGEHLYEILHGHGQSFVSGCAALYTLVLYMDENQGWDPPEPEERGPIIQDWEKSMADTAKHIPVAVEYLSDLITDWSSRVWVISEYHIAKSKKNKKMKYWFIQLSSNHNRFSFSPFSFFEFDFMNPSFSLTSDFNKLLADDYKPKLHDDLNAAALSQIIKAAHDAQQQFHTNMISQVAQQNVIEMILKSKASKPEDRLYAVLPISKYKSKLQSMSADSKYTLTTSISIRLKMFELMNSFDKLALLFISCNGPTVKEVPALPTFATSTITWQGTHAFYQRLVEEYDQQRSDTWNFDFSSQQPFLALISPPAEKNFDILDLRPKEYYVLNRKYYPITFKDELRKTLTFKRLGLDDPAVPLDLAIIPFYVAPIVTNECYSWPTGWIMRHENQRQMFISLIGSLEENKWILTHRYFPPKYEDWKLCHCKSDSSTDVFRYFKSKSITNFYIY